MIDILRKRLERYSVSESKFRLRIQPRCFQPDSSPLTGSLPISYLSVRGRKSIAAYLTNLPPMNARPVIPAHQYTGSRRDFLATEQRPGATSRSRSCRFTALLPSQETNSEKKMPPSPKSSPALRGTGPFQLRIRPRQQLSLASFNHVSLRSCELPLLHTSLLTSPLSVPS
jgi:hypothetical protein